MPEDGQSVLESSEQQAADIGSLLARFPKERPALPPEYEGIYTSHYKSNREGSTPASFLSRLMESWLHRQVAKDALLSDRELSTLEIGAGTLNQLRYEPVLGPYDIVEPFEALYRDSPELARIRTVYQDVHQIPPHRKYDRITSVATFEHICDLPQVLARCVQLLAPGGQVRVSIPSEGSWLWELGWRITTGLEFRLRHGLDYAVLMRHEHVNAAEEIETLLRYYFQQVHVRILGLTKGFSLYRFYACRDPR